MIERIDGLPSGVVGLDGSGDITREDYLEHFIPAVDEALADHDKIRLLYVLGPEFKSFSGGAMWEDGKLGLEHLTHWERMAVVSDVPWVRHTIDAVGYLIPARVRTFTLAEREQATAWVVD